MSEGHNSSLFTFGSSLSCHDRPPACNVTTQTDFCGQDDLPYVLSSGENTTGCFDVHTASKPDEAYFIASTDATKQILHTMPWQDIMESALCVDFPWTQNPWDF